MEASDKELIQKLIPDNPQLKRLMDKHLSYEAALEKFEKRKHLNAQDTLEKKRLQKEKLAGMDAIQAILTKYRDNVV